MKKRIIVWILALTLALSLSILPVSAHYVATHYHQNHAKHTWVVVDGVTYSHASFLTTPCGVEAVYTHQHFYLNGSTWVYIGYT